MGLIKKHYHWVIVALVLAELFIYSGILNNFVSLHMIPVTEELGISRGNFSLGTSIRSLVGFFSTLLSGVFFLKFGYRKIVPISLVIAAIGFLITGVSQGLMMLILGSAVIGISEGFCSTAGASRMVNTWFHSHKGLILGLVTASTGLGGSLFSMVLSGVIDRSGWRASYYLSGLLVALVGLLLFLLVKNRPADMNLRPFGQESGPEHKKKTSRDHWYGYEAKEVYRKPTFYLMIAVVFLSCCCGYSAFSVVVAHLQDCGMSAQEAASIQSVMLLSLAAAKFICGALSDKLGAKFINLLCMGCTVLGLLLLADVNGAPMAIAAVVVFSVALVLTTITVPLLSSALFGYHPQGAIVGIFMALVPAASVITNPVVNSIYDRIGSYKPIFRVSAVFALAVIGLMVLLFVMADRDRKKYEEIHPHLPETEEAL